MKNFLVVLALMVCVSSVEAGNKKRPSPYPRYAYTQSNYQITPYSRTSSGSYSFSNRRGYGYGSYMNFYNVFTGYGAGFSRTFYQGR